MRLLKRRGVTLRSLRDYAYQVDESFFDVIDTEAKAYTLGFWMADGHNGNSTPCVEMSITDREILVQMAAAMGWRGPIHEVPPRDLGHLPQHRVRIGSRRLSDALERLGCVQDKTYRGDFPSEDLVPRQFVRHLVRGWSDGDGTITRGKWWRNEGWQTRIVGTEAVCRGLSAVTLSHLSIPGDVAPVNVGEDHTTWGFSIYANDQMETYLAWLYEGATIFLARKHAKYREFLADVS